MSKKEFPTDREMRHMMMTIDNGIIMAQKRLVARAIREGFTLVTCTDHKHVTETDPKTIAF